MKRVAQYLAAGCNVVPAPGDGKTEHPERNARVELGGQRLGSLYELHPGLLDRGRAAILYLDLDTMLALPARAIEYQPLRRFPTSSFDLSIVAPVHELVANLENKLRQLAGEGLVGLQFLLIFALPPDKKSVSFRLTFGSDDRTLTADEVARAREHIVSGIKSAGFDLRE
jgi:phenylalanyl-tRNA synthetase beta chain